MTKAYFNDGSANMFSFEEISLYECQYFKRLISLLNENKKQNNKVFVRMHDAIVAAG